MKDYDKLILWLDYFDSNIPRARGRRIPNHAAVKGPSLEELALAARRLGLEPEVQQARRPSSRRITGFIQVKKTMKKGELIKRLTAELAKVRSETRKADDKGKQSQQ
ncbi:MAG: signal recognition particle subunit SRP19/SEC65 family protein [Conexivisphaerales archaeon]